MARTIAKWFVPLDADPTIGDLSVSNKTYPFELPTSAGSVAIVGDGDPEGTVKLWATSFRRIENRSDPWDAEWEDVSGELDDPMVAPVAADFVYTIGLGGLGDFEAFYWEFTHVDGEGEVRAIWIAKNVPVKP